MKKLVETELDQDKQIYLHSPERLPPDIYLEFKRYISENYDRYYETIKEILKPLPISQRSQHKKWFHRRYLNDLTTWIIKCRAIESVEPLLRKEIEIKNINTFLYHCLDCLKKSNVDTTRDKELNLDKLRYSELDFNTLKDIFKKSFRYACKNSSEEGINRFVKRILKRFSFFGKGRPEDRFKRCLVVGLLEFATDRYYFNDFHCDPDCKLTYTQDCLFIKGPLSAKIDCPHNKKQSKKYIRWLRKCQKETSTDGWIPGIAYLLAKLGILDIKECNLRKITIAKECNLEKNNDCYRSDCYLKSTGKPDRCSFREHRQLRRYLEMQGIGLCKTADCNECRSIIKREMEKLKLSEKLVPKEKEAKEFQDRNLETHFLNVVSILDELKKVEKDVEEDRRRRLLNPCSKATKQVYEFIADNNKFWKMNWKHQRIDYVRLYLKAKNKAEKGKLLNEISRLSGIKNKNTILQDIKRTIKRNPEIFTA